MFVICVLPVLLLQFILELHQHRYGILNYRIAITTATATADVITNTTVHTITIRSETTPTSLGILLGTLLGPTLVTLLGIPLGTADVLGVTDGC